MASVKVSTPTLNLNQQLSSVLRVYNLGHGDAAGVWCMEERDLGGFGFNELKVMIDLFFFFFFASSVSIPICAVGLFLLCCPHFDLDLRDCVGSIRSMLDL